MKRLGYLVDQTQLESEIRHLEAGLDQAQGRWAISLAVGNGAALVALSSVVLASIGKPILGLVFPSLWLFALGLIAAGLVGVTSLIDAAGARSEAVALLRRLQENPSLKGEAQVPEAGLYWSWGWVTELASGVLFVAGLTYPLIVLSKRLLLTGGFNG